MATNIDIDMQLYFWQNSWAESTKSLSAFRSFDNTGRREIVKPPVRSKSMLSALFVKHKLAKQKTYAL